MDVSLEGDICRGFMAKSKSNAMQPGLKFGTGMNMNDYPVKLYFLFLGKIERFAIKQRRVVH